MPTYFPSLRLSIILTVFIMGVVSVSVAIFTGETYQRISLENQKQAISNHIQRDTTEILDDLGRNLTRLGLSLQHDKAFREVFYKLQKKELLEKINSHFYQYFVTAGVVELEKIYVYDINFNLVTESTEKPENNFSEIICQNQIQQATPRTGAERLVTLNQLCSSHNRSFYSSLVPIGGLIPKGYLQIVANPIHNLKKLDKLLGSPVKLTGFYNGEIFKTVNWPNDLKLNDVLIADYILYSHANEPVCTIKAAHNISKLNAQLNKTRGFLILIALFVTFSSMLIGYIILRKSTTDPVQNLLTQLKRIRENKDNLGQEIQIAGARELKEVMLEFNRMSKELKELYGKISEKNLKLKDEITERKFAEEALQVAHEVLEDRIKERTKSFKQASEQAQKASMAKSEFLSRMSHELRTPLNAILGYSELLLSNTKEPLTPAQHESVEITYRAGMHLLSLINEVLDLSTIGSGSIILTNDEVSLEKVIEETLLIISPMADEHHITLLNSVKDISNIYIHTEHQRLKQILLNILTNAIKYNKKNGKVILLTECISDTSLKISIEDTGIGIAEEQLEEIFSPFNRLLEYRARVDGTGIGLTIARSLVELMGGEIGIQSKQSEGSTFWITIPYYLKDSSTPVVLQKNEQDIPDDSESYENKKVLIVEDDEINQELIAAMLATYGVESDIAENGLVALQKLEQDEDYAFIFMDLNMPKMGGIEATQAIRKLDSSKSNITIIALTANAMQGDKEKCFEAGMNDYIKKPISLKILKETLRKWI